MATRSNPEVAERAKRAAERAAAGSGKQDKRAERAAEREKRRAAASSPNTVRVHCTAKIPGRNLRVDGVLVLPGMTVEVSADLAAQLIARGDYVPGEASPTPTTSNDAPDLGESAGG